MATKKSNTRQPQVTGRSAAVEQALGQIEKQHGKGAIMRLGSEEQKIDVRAIPTGALSLDAALGVGGFPKGRIVEIYGPESSGKTTLALHAIANAQKAGGIAVLIDAEYAFDSSYARKLGVDVENLLVSQPDSGEQALEIADTLVRSGAVDIIVVDSVAALVPTAELEGEMGDSHVGLQARLMSQALRKLTGIISKSGTCLVFINQLRMKIGVMFGNPETTTGGNALKFYSSVRVDVRRIAAIKDGENVVGNRTRAKIVKNKVAPPFKLAEFDIMYGTGISFAGDLLDLAVQNDVVEKSGAWFSFEGERLGQGREKAKDFLTENPDILNTIEDRVREILALPNAHRAENEGDKQEKAVEAKAS
ncbi:MAG: recombinase RecA [Chitinivibrionales bacterium]|nr:recombinase RecA [Chitinivibrionales bacterium]MBD3357844.1 recombinase RecA [Chitinivibrionales bacterium]